MERIRFIDHKSKKILLEDFSGLKPGQEFYDTLETARKTIHSSPQHSVLALFDASDSYFDQEVINSLKEFTSSNTPYIKSSAVVGVTGLLKIALMTITKFSKREFKTFNTREEALDWLASL